MKWKLFLKSNAGIALGCAVLLSQSTGAYAFKFYSGQLKGSFDTDITYGISARTENADKANLGSSYGNRSFQDKGDIFSNAIRGSSTLTLDYKNVGLLVRGNYFHDFEYADLKLASDAEDKLVSDVTLTDAFVYGYFGDNEQFNIRLGQQVISWGENTFIQGALNDINTVDVNKLRQPGLALKDAFIGSNAFYVSWNSDNNWTIESFYLFDFDRIELDPAGSFFATLDAIGEGGGYDHAGNGVIDGACISPDGVPCDIGLVRTSNEQPGGGQYGLAVRKFFPGLFNGTEFALYYQNLHDHVPIISSYFGTGQFFLEYPDNIERFGASFNTNIASWAIGGEYSLRKDSPIQLTESILNGFGLPVGACATTACAPGQKIQGYDVVDRHQIQVTFQRVWGVNHMIGADDSSTLIEVAYGWVDGIPKDRDLGFGARSLFNPHVTDNFSGFQLLHNLTYNAALFKVVNVLPYIAFKYDVDGISNEIAPVFVEDRKALTLGVNFSYGSETITGGISWTAFYGEKHLLNQGGGRLNDSTDRDFVQANISYSF
ncbi:MAG: DUF1302 family protein [Cycloclasticus sp.]|nr:peptide ABC transporter substrate-binding protein [Cycloclasticus sp. 44_32_T64]